VAGGTGVFVSAQMQQSAALVQVCCHSLNKQPKRRDSVLEPGR